MNRQSFFDGPAARPAEYVFPLTVAAAIKTLTEWAGEARIIAGGTDLMLELEKNTLNPRCLVNIGKIPELGEIRVKDEYVEIGAAVTFANLKEHPYINQSVHVLAEAACSVGALAIQNVATLAGNIVNAMPAADGMLAALALDAEVEVVDAGGAEWKPLETLFLGPGKSTIDPTRQLLTQIRFRRFDQRRGTAWYRIGRRPSLTLPVLNCAVSLLLTDDGLTIRQARIAVGPVAPLPFRARQVEQFLEGRPASAENLALAAQLAQKESAPRDNVLRASKEYRLATIPVIVESSLRCALKRALNAGELRDE